MNDLADEAADKEDALRRQVRSGARQDWMYVVLILSLPLRHSGLRNASASSRQRRRGC